jgi:uncharacterized protein involved in exopolysaccharide biosynthesis
MTELNNKIQEDPANEILELIVKLWTNRTTIFKWCAVGIVLALVVGFSLPKNYKTGVIIAPEMQTKTNSSISSIASMMGVNLNNSVDAISHDMYADVIHSTPFVTDLLELPVTFTRRDSVITTTFCDYMLNYQKKAWWSHILQSPFKLLGWVLSLGKEEVEAEEGPLDPTNLPRDERKVAKYLSKEIQFMMDKKTGKMTISMELQDPKVVATVMTAVTENLKKYMSDYRTSKARQDVVNLTKIYEKRREEYHVARMEYAKFSDANRNMVLLSAQAELGTLKQEMDLAYQVYSQVATQLEGARIQAEEAKPVFVIIEPVITPNRKSSPSKAKLLVLYTFLAGCAAVGWITFGKDAYQKFINKL